MSTRRPSPALLVLLLLVACLAPLGVVQATGLVGGLAGDRTETAGGPAGGRGDGGSGGDRAGSAAPSPVRRTTTTAPATTTSTTAPTTTAAPSTAPPTTAPPTTPAPTTPPTTSPPATSPPGGTPEPAGPADEVVALVNAARADAGCGALRVDDRLTAAAQGHSDDMAAKGYFSHTSLDGRSFADRVRAAGYPDPGGENIAQGQRSARAVHEAWMNSEGHRANILNCSFTAIGVGLHADTWTWTQNFGY